VGRVQRRLAGIVGGQSGGRWLLVSGGNRREPFRKRVKDWGGVKYGRGGGGASKEAKEGGIKAKKKGPFRNGSRAVNRGKRLRSHHRWAP